MQTKDSRANKIKLDEPPEKFYKVKPVEFQELFISSSKLISIHTEKVWHPPTDIYETDKHIIVRCEIAGMKPEEISVKIDNNHLIISGYRNENDARAKRTFRQMEIEYGRFERVIEAYCGIETEKINALYKNGFLEIALPKSKKQNNNVHSCDTIIIKQIILKDE